MKACIAGLCALAAGVVLAGSCIVEGSTDRPFGVVSADRAVGSDVRLCERVATDDLSPFDARPLTVDWFEMDLFNSYPRFGLLLLIR